MCEFPIIGRWLLFIAFLHPLRASAQDNTPRHSVRLVRPSGEAPDLSCLSDITITDAVQWRLKQGMSESAERNEAVIEGRMELLENGRSFRIFFEMRAPDGKMVGSRTLGPLSGDCPELLDAVSLVVALMIDPDLPLIDAPSPFKENSLKKETPIFIERKKADALPAGKAKTHDAEEIKKSGDRIRPVVSLSAVLMPNVLPDALPGWGGAIGMRYKNAWQLDLFGASMLRQTTMIEDGEVALGFSHFGLLLRAALLSRGRFGIDAAAGIRAGILSYQGKGFSVRSFDSTAWTLDADVGFSFRMQISKHWRLIFDTTADFFIIRREVVIKDEQDNSADVHRIPIAVFRGCLSAALLF